MNLDFASVANIITASTTSYISEFSPVFLLMGGILLAFIVMAMLVSFLTGRSYTSVVPDFDDDMADDLEEFYSRRGRNDAPWDYTTMQNQRKN